MERAMSSRCSPVARSHIELHTACLSAPPATGRRVGQAAPLVNEIAASEWFSLRADCRSRPSLAVVLVLLRRISLLQTVESRLRPFVKRGEPIHRIRADRRRRRSPPGRVALRHLFSTRLLSFLDRTLQRVRRIETQRELALTAVALKRYRLRHDRWPADLNALVPELLGQPPTDPMDGQPLRYRLNSDGSFTLYSVNVDGKDDSGDPAPPKATRRSNNFELGRDMVWPVPASAEDVKRLPL